VVTGARRGIGGAGLGLALLALAGGAWAGAAPGVLALAGGDETGVSAPAVPAAAGVLPAVSAAETPLIPPDAWRTFERPEAGFAVDLPGEPVHGTEQNESEAGPVEARAWTVETPLVALRVEHHDLPRLVVMVLTDRRLLGMSATRLLEDRKGTLQESEDWSLDGHPGLRLRYTRADRGDAVEEARLVLVERRLFIAFARVTAPEADDRSARAAVQRFFESWSVWPPAG